WGTDNGIFVKRISSDRFMAVVNESVLKQLEETKFTVLDDMREVTAKNNMALTWSIGDGAGSASLIELSAMAQSGPE
ncbi:hypothetical protein R0K17_31870, partial [Planococcus sp. SIMBA_143]